MVGLELAGGREAGAFAAIGITAGVAFLSTAAWWMRRARSPLFDLGVFSTRTFRSTATGGFIYRLTISAVPFLLPLMFQNGFGWDPLRAGVLVAAVFIGNIGIKPATTPLIRRFGFKPVLVFASLASAATFALCALLDAGTPEPLIFALLVASGAFRSIGFSAYASVQYADVVPAQLPSANAVSATLVQLATAAGIAIGALLIRVFEASAVLDDAGSSASAAAADPAAPYRAAFLAIAVIMLLSTLDSLTLPRHAGAGVSRPGQGPAAARPRRPRA
jgi:MFS family permease